MQVLPAAPAMAIGQYHVFKIGGAHERWLGDDEWPESDSEGENNNLRTSSDGNLLTNQREWQVLILIFACRSQ